MVLSFFFSMRVVLKRKTFGFLNVMGAFGKTGNFAKGANMLKAGNYMSAAGEIGKGALKTGVAAAVPIAGVAAVGSSVKTTTDALSGNMGEKFYTDQSNEVGDQGKKSGMGTAAKIGAGIGAVGLGLLGAKKGLFGNTARMAVNRQVMNVGKMTGSRSIVESGVRDFHKGKFNALKAEAQKGLKQGETLSKSKLGELSRQAGADVKTELNSRGLDSNWFKSRSKRTNTNKTNTNNNTTNTNKTNTNNNTTNTNNNTTNTNNNTTNTNNNTTN